MKIAKMKTSLELLLSVLLVSSVSAGPAGNAQMTPVNDRTLFIRSLPGYPGGRSDVYEVYMEPYLFVSTAS